MYKLAVLLLSVACSSAYTPCVQRSFRDFRADDNDCRTFHICSLGRLVTMRCPAGGVFDERSLNCVPAHSFLDRCSGRQTSANNKPCPPGSKDRVPHPTHCALYYDCGASHTHSHSHSHNHPDPDPRAARGWAEGERECPYPLVFSAGAGKCVPLQPGVCGARQEPLDHCDYKTNQCQGHAQCVPCHVRFPSCRGRQDGLNAWAGRQGSPYYVVCQRQRVVSTGMCKQDGAVAIFDQESLKCVKKEDEEKPKLPELVPALVQQTAPHRFPAQGFIPHPHPHQNNPLRPTNTPQHPSNSPQLSPTNTPQHPSYLIPPLRGSPQESSRPQVPEQVHVPQLNQPRFVPGQYQQSQNQYPYQQQQQQQQQDIVHVPYLPV